MVDIVWLAETGPCRKFKAGQHIQCPGGPAESDRAMYILLTGRVDVFRASAAGGTQAAGSLLPGDVFGGREFFTDINDSVYTAGVDSVAYIINASSFNDLSWSRPDILFAVLGAAYLPLRKLSALQKTAMTTAQEPGAKQKTVKSNRSPGGTDASEQTRTFKANETRSVLPAHTEPALLAAVGEIFPEGHRSFPGIMKPDYAKLVFPKEYDCPFCKKAFPDYKVFRSKLYESAPVRYDLRRYYTDFQPEWYDVIVCQNCLFSTIHNYFTEPKPLKKEKIDSMLTAARTSVHMDFDAPRDIDFVFTAHYLALLCADGYLSLGRQIRAKLWGNLSWLYEDVEDEEMAVFSAGKAAEAYEAVYAETRLTPVQEQITCLSIAGMQYRAGQDRNLKRFLFTAKTVKMGDKTYAKIAEDFMYELRVDDES